MHRSTSGCRATVLTLAMVISTVAAACGSDNDKRSDEDVDTNAPNITSTTLAPTTTRAPAETIARTPVPVIPAASVDPSEKIEAQSPDWLTFDSQFVYTRLDRSDVLRLDPATGATVGTIVVGGLPCHGLGAAFGSLWSCRTGDDDSDHVVRIDPSTDQIIATIEINKAQAQGSLVGGFDRLWVLVDGGTHLVGIDPATNSLDAPIELGVVGYDIAVGVDALWVISNRDDAVVRVDPTSRVVTGRVDGVNHPVGIDATADVWVGAVDGTVRIDPTSLEIETTLPVAAGIGGAVAVDGTDLWIRSADRFLVRVDTGTEEILEELDAGVGSGGDVVVAFGAVWATAYDDALMVRHPL